MCFATFRRAQVSSPNPRAPRPMPRAHAAEAPASPRAPAACQSQDAPRQPQLQRKEAQTATYNPSTRRSEASKVASASTDRQVAEVRWGPQGMLHQVVPGAAQNGSCHMPLHRDTEQNPHLLDGPACKLTRTLCGNPCIARTRAVGRATQHAHTTCRTHRPPSCVTYRSRFPQLRDK